MNINTVDFEYDGDGAVDAFIVNDDVTIMNGQDIEGVEEVRTWLADNGQDVPDYSSVLIEPVK